MTTTTHPGRPVLHKRNTRVRIRLCSAHCSVCVGQHEFTDVMDAERIGYRRVRITQPHGNWFGAVVNESDYVFAGDDQ